MTVNIFYLPIDFFTQHRTSTEYVYNITQYTMLKETQQARMHDSNRL